jgi:hypothetical protein
MFWASVAAADIPRVEVVETRGQVDGPASGPSGAPRWERVALELTVVNRLSHAVGDFEFEVELVRSRPMPTAIPGWTFVVEKPELWLEPSARHVVRVEQALPERRETLAAPDINFRVRLARYRVDAPDLDTAVTLLGSASESDQRAALDSFEAERLTRGERDAAVERLAAALDRLPRSPSASDALRLLFALRALGRLGASHQVPRILALTDRLDEEAWGRAVVDLAGRILAVRQEDEPRLEVLPSWAQKKSALIAMKAQDAVREAVRDAIVRMGDAAVPGLMRIVHDERDPAVRERAWRLLVALGRPTVRSQLRLSERTPELEAIEAAGDLRLRDAAAPLVELLDQESALIRHAARDALTELGLAALPALEARLGRPHDDEAARLMPRILRRASPVWSGRSPEVVRAHVADLRAARRAAHRARAEAAIRDALERAEAGEPRAALKDLDAAYEADPELYMRFAAPISRVYERRAETLFAAEDFDAALETARDGLSVRWSPSLQALAHRARLALVRGYVEIEDWSSAEALLDGGSRDEATRALATRVSAGKVREALRSGNRGLARAVLNRARLEAPGDPTLRALHRRMLWLENLPTAIAVLLSAAAAVVALVVGLRRHFESARMRHLEAVLDRR